jgi:hypothetical protein
MNAESVRNVDSVVVDRIRDKGDVVSLLARDPAVVMKRTMS